ncbi:MAG: SMP-30/gluconolactonase/LRE family protein [Acidimicrobiia bacterium]|nr:SMP-30/gluconolactonase/LRE family protein [Acidimicrobiia bacterium]
MDIDVIASDLPFPEGPAVDREGRVHWVEIAGQRIARLADDGSVETFADTGGGPNGCAFAADGWLYVCNNGGSWPRVASTEGRGKGPEGPPVLQRISPDGATVETVLSEIDGVALAGPNDCAFDADGGLWFTDPRWGGEPSSICYLGSDGTALRAYTGVAFPNGIGVTDDNRFVIVCESMTGNLLGFRIEGPGRLGDPKPNGSIGRRSIPDGFCFDSAGRMIIAGHQTNALFVLDAADGRPRKVVDLPDAGPTNCCFGGEDFTTLYVTSSDVGELLAVEWDVPGMRLHPDR